MLDSVVVSIVGAAIFSNFMSLKTALANLENGKTVIFQMNNTYLLDHTVMEFLHDFEHNYEGLGGKCVFLGMETHDTYSRHPLAARRMKPDHMSRRKSDPLWCVGFCRFLGTYYSLLVVVYVL